MSTTRETQERSWFSLALGYDRRGGLTLALADAGAARNAYRDESCDQSDEYFLHWNSPFFTPRDTHFVPRCTVGRPLKPMVHRLRRLWGTSNGTVSWGTQLRVCSKTCPDAVIPGAAQRRTRRPSLRSGRGMTRVGDAAICGSQGSQTLTNAISSTRCGWRKLTERAPSLDSRA